MRGWAAGGKGWLWGEQRRLRRSSSRVTVHLGTEEAVDVWHGVGQAESPGFVWSEASWCERLAVPTAGEADF